MYHLRNQRKRTGHTHWDADRGGKGYDSAVKGADGHGYYNEDCQGGRDKERCSCQGCRLARRTKLSDSVHRWLVGIDEHRYVLEWVASKPVVLELGPGGVIKLNYD